MTSGATPPFFEQRVARVGNARIHYEIGGAGPAVVLLHGLSGSARWWQKNSSVLARDYSVFAIDLIGFGRSHGQRFVLEETVGLIAEWMDCIGVGSFHLVGHSLGGLVAAGLAARHPERVDRLVLVDAAAIPLGRTLIGSAMRLFPAIVYMPLDFPPVLVSDALRAGPLTLLRASYAIHQADITADLARIAARTLIVWGEHDMLLTVECGWSLHQALPGSEFVVVRGAGHNPMWDRAKIFNHIVMGFLKQD